MIELPKQERGFICTKCGSHECKPGTLNDKHPPCAKCDYLGFAQDTGYTADQLRTCIEQSAAEAREQMREECIKACQAAAGRGWSYYEEERRPVLRGKALGADVCVERIKELP